METKIDYRTQRDRHHRHMFLKERFWEKVDKKGEDECWEWKAATNGRYGTFGYDRKHEYSHRISYILTYGNIPEELYVLHKCNNPKCNNPKHLYVGTQKRTLNKWLMTEGHCMVKKIQVLN